MQMKRVAGKPRQGRGLRKRLGAFWKWLERDARVPLQGSVSGQSRFLLPLPGASREKQTNNKNAAGRPPALLCYFCTTVTGKTALEKGCFTRCGPRGGCAGSWCPEPPALPLEGQVLTKLCLSCQVYVSPCVCIYLGCALKTGHNSVRLPGGPEIG